jgi:hypothetical protein
MKTRDDESSYRRPVLDMNERIVGLLLLVEAISVYLLWNLNPFTEEGRTSFALYLALNFISFAMMSYIYRTSSQDGRESRFLLICGSVALAALLLGVFLV